jgi:hypothetical protein
MESRERFSRDGKATPNAISASPKRDLSREVVVTLFDPESDEDRDLWRVSDRTPPKSRYDTIYLLPVQ